jgi:dihydroxyacid dehydratase/phosphogluconate dehydratase
MERQEFKIVGTRFDKIEAYQMEMEATNGGLIAALRNEDVIEYEYNIPVRKLKVKLYGRKFQERLKE